MLKKIVGVIVGVSVAVLLGCPPTPPNPPPTITCGFSDAGVCSGTCPEGQTCSSPSPTICACVNPDAGSCGFNSAKVCGGPCPSGQSCQSPKPTVCACMPQG